MTPEDPLEYAAAQLLDARIGLKPDLSFRPRLTRALRDLAEEMDIDRERLLDALATDAWLLDQLLDRVTVQESGFFRHPEQFEMLLPTVLPTIDTPVRVWSAACANGQEAYSLAMFLSELRRPGSVLATDVSPAALRRTASGHYHEREMGGVSAERRRQHFTMTDNGWQAKQVLRDMVTVQRHNLLDPIPPHVAECHVVMCRNVLIYFTRRHAKLFLDRLADVMDPAALLFVGGAETLWQVTDRFEPIQRDAYFVYRPRPHAVRGLIARRAAPIVTLALAPRASPASRLGPPIAKLAIPAGAKIRTVSGTDHSDPIDGSGHEQQRLGHQLLADGSTREAIVAFRQWAYLSPDNPAAHFQLALALDNADEMPTARRAYRAALTALDRCDPDQLVSVLQGYERAELRRLLVDRSRTRNDGPGSTVRTTPSARSASPPVSP